MVSTKLRVKDLLKERRWTTKVLAEKTGLSESYLTHIKNGTRRWNEDSLKKIAVAFDLAPIDIFEDRKTKSFDSNTSGMISQDILADMNVKIVPVVGEIPSIPSEYNNKLMQLTTGFKDVFVPVSNNDDNSMFCLYTNNDLLAPQFEKGDLLVVSPEAWTRTGDTVAVEYEHDEKVIKTIAQINYRDDLIMLKSVNHQTTPITFPKNNNSLRIIGKVISRYQKYV